MIDVSIVAIRQRGVLKTRERDRTLWTPERTTIRLEMMRKPMKVGEGNEKVRMKKEGEKSTAGTEVLKEK